MSEVTHILNAIEEGDPHAAAELLPMVYDELRKLAAVRIANEQPGQTLDATALVHEAFLRLVGDQQFDGRGHFFAAAAEAMRRILVDKVRSRRAMKRGGGRERVEVELGNVAMPEQAGEMLAIHEVLDRLASYDSVTAKLVKLRYFLGLSMEETASVLGISTRKAERLWTFGRAWLRDAIGQFDSDG